MVSGELASPQLCLCERALGSIRRKGRDTWPDRPVHGAPPGRDAHGDTRGSVGLVKAASAARRHALVSP